MKDGNKKSKQNEKKKQREHFFHFSHFSWNQRKLQNFGENKFK